MRREERRSFRSETNEERDGSYTFYVPVERINRSANARVCRKRTTNGKEKRTREREEGKGKKGKRTARWLPRVPVRLPRRDLTGSCSLRLHELPLLSAQTCAERIRKNKRRRPGMGIVVSNFVLLYALYGGMPYITAVSRLVLPRIRIQS